MDPTWPYSATVVALIILQSGLARYQLGSWLAPGAFFGLMWATVGVLILSIRPEFRIWPGVLWILFMSCSAHLGGLLASGAGTFSRPTAANDGVTSPGPRLPLGVPLVLASSALGTAGVAYLISGSSMPLLTSSNFSFNAATMLASYFSAMRYNNPEFREPPLFLVLSTFAFLAAYLGGTIFAGGRSRLEKLAGLSGVVPALLETIVLGARTSVTVWTITWVASYFATRAYTGERRLWRNWRRALATMGFGLTALTVMYVSVQMLRMEFFVAKSVPEATQREQVLVKAGIRAAEVQFVGHASAFSTWFSENWDVWQAPDLGKNAFNGPAGWLGYKIVRNADEINLSPNSEYNDHTNVYSTLRMMAFDWTLPGSAVFLMLFSALASFAYVKVCEHNAGYIPFVILYYLVAMYVTSFPLGSTVVDVAWVVFAIYLWSVSGAEARGYFAES
jgi:hypothetical protein